MYLQKVLALIAWPYSHFSNVQFSWKITRFLPLYNKVLIRSFPDRKGYPLKSSKGISSYSEHMDVWWYPHRALRKDAYYYKQDSAKQYSQQIVYKGLIYEKGFKSNFVHRDTYEECQCRCRNHIQVLGRELIFLLDTVNHYALMPSFDVEVIDPRHFLFNHKLSFDKEVDLLERQVVRLKAVPLKLENDYPCEEYFLIADYYFLYIDVETGLLLKHESLYDHQVYEVAEVTKFHTNTVLDEDIFKVD